MKGQRSKTVTNAMAVVVAVIAMMGLALAVKVCAPRNATSVTVPARWKTMAKITIEDGDHKYEIYTSKTWLTLEQGPFHPYHQIKIEGHLDPSEANLAVTYRAVYEVQP